MCIEEVDKVREKPRDTAGLLAQKSLRVKLNKNIFTLLSSNRIEEHTRQYSNLCAILQLEKLPNDQTFFEQIANTW